MRLLATAAAVIFVIILGTDICVAQRQMETLDRGLVAVGQTGGGVFLSWRRLGTDPAALAFNI